MGIWDDITAPVGILSASRRQLAANLATASSYLGKAELVFDEKHKIAEYRSKVDLVVSALNAPETVDSFIKDIKSAMQVAAAVSDLRKIRFLNSDPDRAAYAFGRLFAGLGKLAHLLPPGVDGYFAIFADAEMFFVNIRRARDPRVHMREPGALEETGMDYDF